MLWDETHFRISRNLVALQWWVICWRIIRNEHITSTEISLSILSAAASSHCRRIMYRIFMVRAYRAGLAIGMDKAKMKRVIAFQRHLLSAAQCRDFAGCHRPGGESFVHGRGFGCRSLAPFTTETQVARRPRQNRPGMAELSASE